MYYLYLQMHYDQHYHNIDKSVLYVINIAFDMY